MQFHDNKKPSKYITYLDANNFYVGQWIEFKWLNQKEIDKFNVKSIGKNGSNGYIWEVDLEYPDESHKSYNDYPVALDKLEISNDMLLKYCSDIAKKIGIKVGGVNILVQNLGNKSKYVLHYRNFQLYLSLGMKLVKVHKILKSKQSDWLKKHWF